MTLVLLPSQLAPVVAMQAWVTVGSADERPDQAGLSHVMEHMLFKGTPTRGVGGIASDVEAAGGEINAWTSRDETVFHVVMPSRYAEVGIDVLGDALCNASLDPGELEREREVILEEIRQGRDEPLRALVQNMFAGAFDAHSYARPVIGSEASVTSFRRADLERFRKRWYRGGNMALVVAGDFDPELMHRRVVKSFSALPTGKSSRRRGQAHRCLRQSATLETAELQESQLAVAFRAPRVSARDFAALDLLSVALGQGESSGLARDLVRTQGLCQSAYAYVHALKEGSLFILGASATDGQLDSALPIIGDKLRELAEVPLDPATLAKARQIIASDSLYRCETAEGVARSAGSYFSLVGDPGYEASYLREVATLEAADLIVAARKYLDPSRMHLSALVPKSGTLRTPAQRRAAGNALHKAISKAMLGVPSSSTASVPPASAAPVRHRLKNGMRLVIKRDASVPLVSVRGVWSGGQLLEGPSQSGITELLASTLTLGCGRRSADEVLEEVDARAASLSGFAGRNSFGIRSEWLQKDWSTGLDLLTDCLLAPRFDEAEVAWSRREQLARLASQKDSPTHQVFRLFRESLFGKHPYRRNALGTAESVRGIGAEDLRRFYRKNYRVADLSLAIVGDVDPTKLIARIESRFGGETTTPRPPRKAIAESFAGRSENARTVFAHMDREQSHLVLGFPGMTIHDPERHALEVLVSVLGGHGGRLFVELRDRQSLAYQVKAVSLEGLDPGYVALYLSCAPEKADAAMAELRKQLDAIVNENISQEELARTQRYLIGTHEISLQRRSSQASALAFHEAYGLAFDEHEHYARHIESVRADDVRRVARRIFDWDLAVSASVVPPTASPKAAKRMRGVLKKRPRRRPTRGRK